MFEDEFLVNGNARAEIAQWPAPVDWAAIELPPADDPAPAVFSTRFGASLDLDDDVFANLDEGVFEAIGERVQARFDDVFVNADCSPF